MRVSRAALAAIGLLGTALPATAQEPPPQDIVAPAERSETTGLQGRVDQAYGAFQRGFYLTALELALPRAEKGDAAAQTLIAEIYSKGLGVAENIGRAAGWYALASKNGSALASFQLALLYQAGRGVAKDPARAANLFQMAADAGYPPAKYNLALLHLEGVNAEPSIVKAAELMKSAADAALPEAQYDYGIMLMDGAGVASDRSRTAGAPSLTARTIEPGSNDKSGRAGQPRLMDCFAVTDMDNFRALCWSSPSPARHH